MIAATWCARFDDVQALGLQREEPSAEATWASVRRIEWAQRHSDVVGTHKYPTSMTIAISCRRLVVKYKIPRPYFAPDSEHRKKKGADARRGCQGNRASFSNSKGF